MDCSSSTCTGTNGGDTNIPCFDVDCSTTTSTGTNGVQFRSKRRRRASDDHKSSSNVVARMLSHADSLLTMCLCEGRLAEAAQVARVFISPFHLVHAFATSCISLALGAN